ncbi:MAG: hypothetical protein IJA65_02125, partial [Acholeplasmatales bacterium]|nr:hypothetical protein [Acholeplasmatales bacterium]
MANKGLKSYTKQITGNIGMIGYNVNVNSDDSNLILTIPAIESGGINPIGLSLIYNYQNKEETSTLGAGIRLNNEYRLYTSGDNYLVYNPDGSHDLYKKMEEKVEDSKTIKIYKSATSDISLYVETENQVTRYYLKDKEGNKYKWNNGFKYISQIEKVDGFKINYNPEDGVFVNNDDTTRITYTANSYNNVKEIKCIEDRTEISNIIYSLNDNTNEIISIVRYFAGVLMEKYNFEFATGYIKIYEEKSKYGIKFTLQENKVWLIDEEFYDNVEQDDGSYEFQVSETRRLYNMSYSGTETIITNGVGDTLTVVFDEDNREINEYDNKGNFK